MNKLILLFFATFFCVTSVANTLSDCIADALDRLVSQDLTYTTHVYVECDNLPLDLLTREDKNFRFVSGHSKFIYNTNQLYIEAKNEVKKTNPRQPIRRCEIKYELNRNILTITIIPYCFEYRKNGYFNGLWDWYVYNYKYNFVSKRWIFESNSIGGI